MWSRLPESRVSLVVRIQNQKYNPSVPNVRFKFPLTQIQNNVYIRLKFITFKIMSRLGSTKKNVGWSWLYGFYSSREFYEHFLLKKIGQILAHTDRELMALASQLKSRRLGSTMLLKAGRREDNTYDVSCLVHLL
jgi:hypothetical protein